MRVTKHGFVSDIAFICMLVLLFVCVAFLSMYASTVNTIIFALICAVMVVTYFTSVTAGLVIDIVLIFAGTSWMLFGYTVLDTSYDTEPYFWMAMLPLLTLCAGIMAKAKRDLEATNAVLKNELTSFATIDELTGLKNIHAYESEMTVYANIAQRNGLLLGLLVLEFRYPGEMKAFVGDERLMRLSVKLSEIIDATLRGGDTVYLLSRSPYRWGALLLLKPGSSQIVMDRLKSSVAQQDFSEFTDNHIHPEVRIGTGENQPGDQPMQLFERAVANMEYDV